MIYDYIEIEKDKKTPLCTQLYEELLHAITEGKFPQGQKVPSIRTAATELSLSRTTVETAYIRLCNEGYLDSRPQSGYFVKYKPIYTRKVSLQSKKPETPILYDFSSGRIDEKAADTLLWQKQVRTALHQEAELFSYGEPQGEEALRHAISDYIFTTRGVEAYSENIVVGAGTQFLLTLFCSLYSQKAVIAMDAPGFKQAERIFRDYGFETVFVDFRNTVPLSEQLESVHANIYLHIPSSHAKRSAQTLKKIRADLLSWVQKSENRLILEDDYNGELRYTARPLPALQNADREHIVYLGSFSKLLLPSVRIAYMVLPDALLQTYRTRRQDYNPTASKLEQLALTEYIRGGYLEKHLRRLQKLYYHKSQAMLAAIQRNLPLAKRVSILETSLCAVVHLETPFSDAELQERLRKNGIIVDAVRKGHLWLSFSGIPEAEIEPAVRALTAALQSA